MLCSHFSFIFLVSPAEQELLPVQPQSRSSYSPSGTQQPGPVGPGPPHSCRTSTPWVHTSILPPGMCHVTALNTWIPTHRLHLMGRARLPCSPGTSPHHGQPWVCTAPVTSTQCHGVWWNRKGFFSKRKSKPPQKEVLLPPAGFSAPGLAEQGSRPFPSLPAAADTRLGGFQLLCAHVLQVFVLAKCKASRTLQLINMCQGSLRA